MRNFGVLNPKHSIGLKYYYFPLHLLTNIRRQTKGLKGKESRLRLYLMFRTTNQTKYSIQKNRGQSHECHAD